MKFKYYLIILLSLFLTSCSVAEIPVEVTKSETKKFVKEIQKDTVFFTKKDSSYYKAYIKCINNTPVLLSKDNKIRSHKEVIFPEEVPGEYLKPPSVVLNGNILNVSCEAKAQRLFVKWKERFIQEQTIKTKTIIIPPKLIEKQLSWWQTLWISLGKIAFGSIAIWLLTKMKWTSLLKLLLP